MKYEMESQSFLTEIFVSTYYDIRHENNLFFSSFMKSLRRKIVEREEHVKELSSRIQVKKVSDQLFWNKCFLPVYYILIL